MQEIIGMKMVRVDGYLPLKTITLVFTLTMKLFYSLVNFHLVQYLIIHLQKAVQVN